MKALLDTHIALWAIAESEKLSQDVRTILESQDNDIYYSVVSVWEIALKHALHPENMPIAEERFVELCEQTGFLQLAITSKQIYRVKELHRAEDAPKHNDPFDRLLIAQAKEEDLKFLTHDSLLPYYEEPFIVAC